jgi:threonine dehydrogenase-like Zn-dependent dehydrogenase
VERHDIRCESVPDPKIEHDRDAIIKITACAICGSDLHLFDGIMPSMEKGDVLGHETMGEVVEVGKGNSKLKVGDRVVVPFTISCGECFFCKNGFFSGCQRSNPNAKAAERMWGHSPAGLFGYSHMLGGFAGGQAQFLRVPYADVRPIKVPDGLTDDQVLFLSDIFPTGYMAADFCNLKGGETVAIWGCGPVGQFAIKSAFLLGTERVIAIDTVGSRGLRRLCLFRQRSEKCRPRRRDAVQGFAGSNPQSRDASSPPEKGGIEPTSGAAGRAAQRGAQPHTEWPC